MSPRLRLYWLDLRSSFWFVPALMTLGAIGLSFAMVWIDERFEPDITRRWLLFAGRAEGGRAVLVAIAGSMITVAGLAFSIMVVALTLASQQYGPRLLRGFMRDTSNQVVLGTFIATFIYSLLILRTVRSAEEGSFVPQASIGVAVLLAVLSVGVLIFFLHHAAVSIRSVSVISAAGRDLDYASKRMFPQPIGDPEEAQDDPPTGDDRLPDDFEEESEAVRSDDFGYLRSIDARKLLSIARERGLLLRIEVRPGHYVLPDEEIVRAWPGARLDEHTHDTLRSAFILGAERSAEQDVEFAIEELAEVAVRALSPGMNDPFTAIRCIDRMTASLVRIAETERVSPYRYDRGGSLRVVAYPQAFPDLVGAAFDRIRQAATRDVAVSIRLLDVLGELLSRAIDEESRDALLEQARLLSEEVATTGLHPLDLREVERRMRRTVRAGVLRSIELREREDAVDGE